MDKLTRKLSEALNLMKLIKWDTTMQTGDQVLVCWTNSNRFYRLKGKVVKLNAQSVKCELTEPSGPTPYGAGYPVGQVITCPRATMSGVTGRWSWNNCVLPLDQSVISESEVEALRHG